MAACKRCSRSARSCRSIGTRTRNHVVTLSDVTIGENQKMMSDDPTQVTNTYKYWKICDSEFRHSFSHSENTSSFMETYISWSGCRCQWVKVRCAMVKRLFFRRLWSKNMATIIPYTLIVMAVWPYPKICQQKCAVKTWRMFFFHPTMEIQTSWKCRIYPLIAWCFSIVVC